MDAEGLELKLTALYMEWDYVCKNGAAGTVWTDGQTLNFIRRKIEILKKEMKSEGCLPEIYYHELPPLMKDAYMRDADKIRLDAKNALNSYLKDKNYRYLLENAEFLEERERETMKNPPEALLMYVKKLETAVKTDYVMGMKKYLDVERMLLAFKSCRAELEEELEDVIPF